MSFFTHTASWTKGEMFEAALIAGVGFLAMGIACACWRLGVTPGAKAVFVPLLVAGALLAAAGVSGYFSNQKRLVELEQAFQEQPQAFVQAEKERVEGFQYLYTITLVIVLVFFGIATVVFWLTLNLQWRAVGLVLAFVGLSGLTIDYFSKERADIYYEAIRAELGET